MARPRKNNAEYFSHDVGMRNDEKILALRNKFKNEGYAIWCMFLEVLASSEGFKKLLQTSVQKELLAGDLRVSEAEMVNIISFCIRIDLLKEKNGVYWSENLIKRLNPMIQKRENMRQKYEENAVSEAEMPVSEAEMPQSKVKESKVKESIVAKATPQAIKIRQNISMNEELIYEPFEGEKKKPARYGSKTMAIIIKEFLKAAEIEWVGTYDANPWLKPLSAVYNYFNKDIDETIAFIRRAAKYFQEKNLSFTPHTLHKNLPLIDKWIKNGEPKINKNDKYGLYG